MGIRTKTILFHLAGWFLFLVLMIGFARGPQNDALHTVFRPSLLLFVAVYVFLFYLNLYLLFPKLYLRKNYLGYFGVTLLLLFAVYFLKPFDRLATAPHRFGRGPEHRFERREPPPAFNDAPPFEERGGPPQRRVHLDIVSIVLFLGAWSASSAIQIFRQWRTTERRALQAERDKVSAELSFLKAQINPHFLFNTLNNIYSLAITKSDKTPDAVMKLSNILRYITDDVHSDFVPLQSEVDCVQDFIALQKLRLTDKVQVEFDVLGELAGKQIAPLLFMTFIENAFKYGVSNHEQCTITIRIVAEEKRIKLFCRNHVFEKRRNEEREGVGISNTHKRLDYLYLNQYSLQINKGDGTFTVNLTLDT